MNCSNCGADLDVSLERCEYCGRAVPKSEAPAEPAPAAAEEPSGCTSCGYDGEPVIAKRMTTVGILMVLGMFFMCLPLFFIPLLIPQFKEEAARCGRCRAWLSPQFGNVTVALQQQQQALLEEQRRQQRERDRG